MKIRDVKVRILLGILLVATILIVTVIMAACFLTRRINQDVNSVSVSTDKQEYQVGDIVRISIQNSGERSVDIYCLESCALGNFPTMVESSVNILLAVLSLRIGVITMQFRNILKLPQIQKFWQREVSA